MVLKPELMALEEIRAELDDSTIELVEAKRHLDALAYWLSEHDHQLARRAS